MIPVPSGVRVWLAVGRTDMRRGMNGLALQVQQMLKRDPHGGDLYIFRGRRGDLIKILWHDGLGMSLYAKRLERGRFIWPSPADGVVSITPAQLAYLLEGIVWTPSAGQGPDAVWIAGIGCGFVSGLSSRPAWPLALMDCPPPRIPILTSRFAAHPFISGTPGSSVRLAVHHPPSP
jgi:transposase